MEYTLRFHCKILPEFMDFIKKEYLKNYDHYDSEATEDAKKEYMSLPKSYRDLIDICIKLCVPGYIMRYVLHENDFMMSTYKNQHCYNTSLTEMYRQFMEDVIVPISSEITFCEITCEDYANIARVFSDSELRHIHFSLQNKIKEIEHIYNEEGTEILETRVVYKHSIKPIQYLDLNRAYGRAT